MQEDDKLKMNIAALSLNNMMRSDYFSICTIDNILKMMNIKAQDSEAYNMLQAMHCIHYNRMSKEIRDTLPDLFARVFGLTITVTPEPKQSFFGKLLPNRT